MIDAKRRAEIRERCEMMTPAGSDMVTDLLAALEAAEARNAALTLVVRLVAESLHECFEQDCPECDLRRMARSALDAARRGAGGTEGGAK